jgi:hypothetical protein
MENHKKTDSIQKHLEKILARYAEATPGESFGRNHELWPLFEGVVEAIEKSQVVKKYPRIELNWSAGKGRLSKVPFIALLDRHETSTTQKGIYCTFLFRQDMTGVYLTYNQGVTEYQRKFKSQAREIIRSQARELRSKCSNLVQQGFKVDDKIDLRADASPGKDYEDSTIAYKLYEAGKIPDDQTILQDLDAVLYVYNQHVEPPIEEDSNDMVKPKFDLSTALQGLTHFIANQGFVFEPWQIAAYVAALRTKPFVILAGISGTGKSKLPAIVAEGTGGKAELIPVRPDWIDSADVLGYVNLQDQFKAGLLLKVAKEASDNPNQHFVCIVDEMNLARVEHYFAEILSRIEDRRPTVNGGFASGPLLNQQLAGSDAMEWGTVGIPPNLAIVGTVNMDESTHGFSRKVLDRAFTLEFSDINLHVWESNQASNANSLELWPIQAWRPRATRLSQLDEVTDTDRQNIQTTIQVLTEVNRFLTLAQLQVGYRTRDEVALFMLHAQEILPLFVTSEEESVNPLDLALQMKILPRIVGGSNAIRQVILRFLGWAGDGKPLQMEEDAQQFLNQWESETRPLALAGAKYPHTAARLCLMWERLLNEGFTSFWL